MSIEKACAHLEALGLGDRIQRTDAPRRLVALRDFPEAWGVELIGGHIKATA